MAREKVEFDVVGNDRGGSKAFRDTGDAAAKAGDKVEGFGEDLRRVNKDIDEGKKQLQELAREFARTGDIDVWKNLRKQKGELRKLLDVKQIMQDAGEEAAGGFVTRFVGRLGPLIISKAPIAVNPAVVAIGAPLAAGIAAFVGASISGAIIGGVGVGGVIGGLVVASKHTTVQAAAKSLGDEVGSMLQRGFVSFVPATVEGIGIFRSELQKSEGVIQRLGEATARFVAPLSSGAAQGFREALSGIVVLAERAGPVVDAVAAGFIRMGKSIRDGLLLLSDNTASSGRALAILFGILDIGTRVAFRTLNALTELWEKIEFGGAVINKNVPQLMALRQANEEGAKASSEYTGDLQELLKGFEESGDAAAGAAVDVETFTEKLRRLRQETLAAKNSEIALEEAIDNATEARKENGRTLDINTAKGRANMRALLDIAAAAQQNAEDIRRMTGSEELATAATERARTAFIAQARAMGASAKEAEDLANQLFGLPKTTTLNVRDNIDAATGRARKLKTTISGIPRNVFIRAEFDLINNADVAMALRLGRLSEGGLVTGPGTGTSDDIVRRVSNGEYVVRAAAVQAVGVPFLEALNQTDRTGGVRTPARGNGGGAAAVAAPFDEERMARALRRALDGMTLRIDDQTGTRADLIARGG